MISCKGIAVTDEINLYNEIFSLEAMYKAYEKQWNTILPSFANHNHKYSIGYSNLTGVYLDSQRAYTTNSITIAENKDEEKKINEINYYLLYKNNVKDNIEQYESLENKLKDYIEGTQTYYWTNCVFMHNKNIVERVFPHIVEKMENGLVDLDLLTPVLPGIYKIGDFLIFAHLYFRRGYSYLNTLNTPFLSRIEGLERNGKSIKIAIDLDCIGLAGTEHAEHEYSYWWGPKFDNDLNGIPLGVTRHENEHYDKLFSEFLRTEFGWYIQDSKHTFESEEITDIPNILIEGSKMYACRFVHSMVDNTLNVPIHLDGAVRTYDDEKMIERLDISIKDSERNTLYTKLWRIDGEISVPLWKELITHYYRDNTMIGEYFGGKDEKIDYRIQKRKETDLCKTELKDFLPCNIMSGEGIKIYFSYAPKIKINNDYNIYIRTNSFLSYENKVNKFIESETISLCKLIRRMGKTVRIPYCKQVSFFDTVYNYPIFECGDLSDANHIVAAIKQFCELWHTKDDRIISFTLKIPFENRTGVFKFLGHVNDFFEYYSNGFDYIPEDEKVLSWLLNSYEYIKKNFSSVKSEVHPFDIINSCGNLAIKRCFVPSEKIESFGNDGCANLLLTKYETSILKENKLTAVIALMDESKRCSKCKKNYQDCSCISIIDEDVYEEIENCNIVGATWTNRSAFI